MSFPQPQFFRVGDLQIACHQAGSGVPVLLCHGWPELAFSWRNQLPALAAAGYRVIVPDQRGYGKTRGPADRERCDIRTLCGDLVGLLDVLEIEKAVFCGHDWGGFLTWMAPRLHPDRVAGVISLNTPFTPRSQDDPIAMMRASRGESYYIVQIQEEGVADNLLAENCELLFRMFYAKRPPIDPSRSKLPREGSNMNLLDALRAADIASLPPPIIPPEELAFYIQTFQETGFSGGLNWYRNISHNWEITAGVPDCVEVPSLMISAADDRTLPPSLTDGMEKWIPDLEKHVIADCGHWTQQEQPEKTNALLLDWLGRRFPPG